MQSIELSAVPKLFFFHIPKTAGTSLVSVLENKFEKAEICQAYSTFDLKDIPLEQLECYRFFRGHINLDALNRLLIEKPQVITLIRNPQEQAVSIFGNIKNKTDQQYLEDEVRKTRYLSLEEYIYNPWLISNRDYRNFQTELLTRRILLPSAVDFTRLSEPATGTGGADKLKLETAFNLLEGFKFVGLSERLEDSLSLLSYTMGWQPFDTTPHLNKGFSNETPGYHQSLQNLYDEIARNSPQDMELYQRTQQLFEKRFIQMSMELLEHYGTSRQAHLKLPLPAGEMFTLLDKHYHKKFVERNKSVSFFRYNMNQPLTGRQWHERNLNQEHGLHRWSGPEPHSTLDFPLATDSGDLKIKFRVLAALTPEILESLRLYIDDYELHLHRSINPDTSIDFEGIIPASVLEQGAGLTRLNFKVSHTVAPITLDPTSTDYRRLGINLNWVEFSPGCSDALLSEESAIVE